MILVYSLSDPHTGLHRTIGVARSFGEAKRLQQDSLPDDLKEAYAGIQDGHPLFYAELLGPDLLAKYPHLAPDYRED